MYNPGDWSAGIVDKVRLEGVTSVSLSPGQNANVAMFVAEKKVRRFTFLPRSKVSRTRWLTSSQTGRARLLPSRSTASGLLRSRPEARRSTRPTRCR